MSIKAIPIAVAVALAGGSLLPSIAFSAVGEQVNKSMSQNIQLPAEIPASPSPEAAHAFVKYLRFYVPAQSANGTATTVPYNENDGVPDTDGPLVKERTDAKPLIGVFLYGPSIPAEPAADENAGGFVGHGWRDAYGAISLDDGQTWKATNLSESATQSSFDVANSDPNPYPTTAYPGDVVNIVHATSGNRVVAAWQSRFCEQGSPAYTLSDNTGVLTEEGQAVATHLGITSGVDLYLDDVFGVAGSQGSVDYTADYPTVGEVPFNCLWTARGVLVPGDDPRTADAIEGNHMVWFKPERLTSGRRDVNRVEIQMVAGAGAAITWQEDPEGLFPGRGLGPGEGWSGARANSQTDIWYSFLPWEHFVTVDDGEGNPIALIDDAATPDVVEPAYWPANTEKPKHYVPFAVPMRLTNNARCDAGSVSDPLADDPYCATADTYGLALQCTDTVEVPQGSDGTPGPVCVSASGLPNLANTGATRARLSLQPRDTNSDGNTDSAWVVVISEEDKGMGRYFFKVDETTTASGTATSCTETEAETDATCEVADDGKNIWYYSFDMGSPQTSLDTSATGLVANLVSQGNLINQPEVNWRTGATYLPLDTADMWNFNNGTTDYNFEIYRTEIARRGSLMVQPLSNVATSDLTALLLYKQGLLNQGGPADIMARRLVRDPGAVDSDYNPYDFDNLVCTTVIFGDGSNPYYPKGICDEPAINLSAVTPQSCVLGGSSDGSSDTSDGTCPTVDGDGSMDDLTDPTDQTAFDKVTTWIQCPGSPDCGTNALSTALGDNLDDQSWYNPLDVAKGHRGYIWGNMVVVMYAWSPNWKLNAKGSDRYELYIRRSFDGGLTWTTTPASWGGTGTATCETMRDGETSSAQSTRCTTYLAGYPEQARNVSQIRSLELLTPTNRYTVLDPRYAPDPPTMPTIGTDTDATWDEDSDLFNPSRFFVVFETGDNTTVALGEAEPLDLNYGRAINFGDHYQVTSDEADLINTCSQSFCNEFDRLNVGGDTTGSEASLAMTPAGDTLYAVWAQHDEGTGESDAQYARVWYDDPNIFTPPPESPPTTSPPSGDDPYVPGDPQDPPPTDGTTGGNGGCSVGNASAFDPLLPGLVLAALGYLGLRRRMGGFH